MKPYEYVITYSIQNHQKIIKIRRSFCVQEIRLKINTGDKTALKLESFPVLAHLSTNQHSTNSIIHIKQHAAGILQDCTGEVWGVEYCSGSSEWFPQLCVLPHIWSFPAGGSFLKLTQLFP